MTKKLFGGLNCTNGVPGPQEPKQLVENVEALAKELGLSETCQRMATTRTRNSSTSAGVSGKLDMLGFLGPSASVSANFQTSAAALDNEFRESGCGSLMLDSKDILESVRRINCTINNNSATTNQQLSNRVSVQVRVETPPGLKEKMTAQVVELTGQMAAVREFPEVARMIRETIRGLQRSINKMGDLTITNSIIRAKAGSRLKTLSQTVTSVANELEADYARIVEASANNVLQQKAGTNALQPSVRQLVQQRIQSQTDEINADITQTLSNTSIRVTQSGSIVITAPNSITLTDTMIDGNSEIDMMTSALTSSSVELGKRIASELMSSAASQNEVSTDNAGLADLLDAMNEGNAASIAAQSEGLIGQINANKTPLAIGLVALIVLPLLLGNKNNGLDDGEDMPSGMSIAEQRKWKSTQGKKKMFKIVLGLLVKLIVIFNLVRLGPKLLNVFLPWKWNEAMDAVIMVGINLVVLIAYCVLVNKAPNPVMCLLKF